MAGVYTGTKDNILNNVSLYAIFRELGRRELQKKGVSIELKKDQYIIKINKKEVEI